MPPPWAMRRRCRLFPSVEACAYDGLLPLARLTATTGASNVVRPKPSPSSSSVTGDRRPSGSMPAWSIAWKPETEKSSTVIARSASPTVTPRTRRPSGRVTVDWDTTPVAEIW